MVVLKMTMSADIGDMSRGHNDGSMPAQCCGLLTLKAL